MITFSLQRYTASQWSDVVLHYDVSTAKKITFFLFVHSLYSLSLFQQKSVSRKKCAACKIVAHTICIEQLEKVILHTFKDILMEAV